MGYCGVGSIPQLQCDVEMIQITTRRTQRVAPARCDDHAGSPELQRVK